MKVKSYIFRRLSFSIVLILIVLLASAYVTHYVKSITLNECYKNLQSETTEIDRQINEYFNSVRNAVSGQVNMVTSSPNLKDPIMVKKLSASHSYSLQTNLRLYLPDGYAILEDGIHQDISDLLDYSSIESIKPYFSEPHENILKPGQIIIEAFQPVRDHGRVYGMFSSVIYLDNIPQRIKMNTYGPDATFYVVDRSTNQVIIDKTNNTPWDFSSLQAKTPIPGFSFDQFNSAVSSGNRYLFGFSDKSKYDSYYGYTLPSQVSNWNIVLIVPEKIAMEKVLNIMSTLWHAFAIEVLAFLVYFVWTFFDTSRLLYEQKKQSDEQAKIEAAAAQKDQLEKQQIALEQALRMAQSANRAKTVFLNNMSHDIRTPMNAIIGYTNLALSHIKNETQVQEYLHKIDQSSDHLLSLINDILDMSRIESGKMALNEKDENLSDIVHSLQNMIQADLENKNLQFSIEYQNFTNPEIICDRLRVNQVLLNILSNAIKYTQPEGSISMSLKQKDGKEEGTASYEFRIKDTGIGMNEEFLKTIYEPFTRVRSSTVSGIQGTGLGMSIAKNIVEMMGGTIQIISKENVGTEVILNFCFKLHSNERVPEIQPSDDVKVNFKGTKILVVEDNDMNLEITTELLQEEGCIITSAKDGAIAVETVRNSKPGDFDLILMDIQMPIMDGYEATRQIRALSDKALAGIPIIAMTANAFAEDRKEALDCGMNEHVPKPLNMPTLKAVMARFIKQ